MKKLLISGLLILVATISLRSQVQVSGGQTVVLASLAAPYTVGDIATADTTTTLQLVNDIAAGNALLSGGVGTIPSWGKIGLTTHVSGILPTANGGTGIAYFTVAGPSTARVYTFPDAAATVLTTNALVANAQIYGGITPASSTGFGVTPGVIEAGSIDFGGRVTIGAGGDTTGAVTFGGTYSVAPHCVANNETSAVAVKASASTTILTLTGTFTAADKITWVCK